MLNRKITRRNALKILGAGIIGSLAAKMAISRRHASGIKGEPAEKIISTNELDDLKMYPTMHKPAEKIISTRGGGVKRVIENWPDVAKNEIEFYKVIGESGKVHEWMLYRGRNSVTSYFGDMGRLKSYVHTHPLGSSKTKHLTRDYNAKLFAYLSPGDFSQMSEFLERKAIITPTVFHVATVDESGKVIGYTSVRLGKKFFDKYNARDRNVLSILGGLKEDFSRKPTKEEIDSYIEWLYKLKDCGVQIKGTPMPGYVFKGRYFQKK